jgi:circadian clock protein KaiB
MKAAKTKATRPAKSLPPVENEMYVLRLYVTGLTPNSTRAIANIKALCRNELAGRYDLQIVDIYQQPEVAKSEQIVAAPTLIKQLPLPLRRLVGDLSQKERVLLGLNLRPTSTQARGADPEGSHRPAKEPRDAEGK